PEIPGDQAALMTTPYAPRDPSSANQVPPASVVDDAAQTNTVAYKPAVPAATKTASWPQLPGFEILGELGRGGMGVVYHARHLALKRPVALKMVLSGDHAAGEDLARFRAEAEAVAALRHPNIVQIYEIGEHRARPYFALEFMDGGSLDRKLAGSERPA